LAREGAQVTICSRNERKLRETAKEIESSTGVPVLFFRIDLNNEDEIKTLVEKTIVQYGKIDVLVTNTGGPPLLPFLETSRQDWCNTVNSLLMSVIHCCKEVIPYMKKQKGGRIINMTSFSAKQPAERLILSNAVRAGVLGITKTLSNELGEYRILVNAVCPGWTLTKRIEELARAIAENTGKTYGKVITEWEDRIPLKRLAQPEEIAHLVVFLASDRASYITGTTIQVDGGYIQSLL
jgi:3-oxoacyl-[acyl-carrier protein] reductase